MKSLSRFANSLISLQNSLCSFYSSSSSQKLVPDGRNDAIEDSLAYRRSMLRRPPTVKPWKLRRNCCSFIGIVIRPVMMSAGKNPRSSAYTILEVKTPSLEPDPFKILLLMRGKLSDISLRYLKPNDHIYVRGALHSYEKVDVSGKREIFHQVVVAELNFVACNNTNQIAQKPDDAAADLTVGTSCEFDQEKESLDEEERYRARLRLWQVFFASPHEWWDNRKGKRTPGMPDFKHKDTKECLWLKSDDPPWVRKQLQAYDSSMGRVCHSRSDAYEWNLEDLG